jgi:MFS family permease
MTIGPIQLFSQATRGQRRTLAAAALGWMLDSFDAMLYALVLAHVMRDLGMTKSTAGLLNSLTLLASGIGGVMFGFIADRIGRKRALMGSILTYSVCSFASGLSTSVLMLAAFRFVLGLGMGGEWNTGATLVAETWPSHLRAKAIAVVQSSWAIGYALAALVAGIVLHFANWRVVFFVGIVPAAVTLWIRRGVPESAMWEEHRVARTPSSALSGSLPDDVYVDFTSGAGGRSASSLRSKNSTSAVFGAEHRVQVGKDAADADEGVRATRDLVGSDTGSGFGLLFRKPYVRYTFALLFVNFFGMFAWWGLFTWLPPYLSLPVEQGGRGFGVMGTTTLLVVLNLFGMFPGYASFGWVADHLGRRKSFLLYTFGAAVLVPLYAQARSPIMLLVLGTLVAFFGTGFFSGSGILGSEIFPTRVRARALGFTYNGARAMSSIAPWVIGSVGQVRGLSWAFYLCAASFGVACLVATQLPETLGRELE